MNPKTVVTGVIGSDTHIVGNRILTMALENAGYPVVSLGALTPAPDFVKAAVETAADAILVSSLYGQGELDCRGFRDLCVEAGLERILLYAGGNALSPEPIDTPLNAVYATADPAFPKYPPIPTLQCAGFAAASIAR